MSRIYLASHYTERHALLIYARLLEADGHRIVSSWIDGHHERPGRMVDDGRKYSAPDDEIRTWALEDWSDVLSADVLILFTDNRPGRGGKDVEFGAALALDKRCIIIGPRSNLFHYLHRVEHYIGWAEFVAAAPLTQPDPVARRPR